MSDFHPVSLACPLLLFAWWFLDQRRLLPFALFAAAALATKEHVGLTVAAMGVWYAIRYREPRTGSAIAVVAGSVALVAALVIVPHFAPAGVSAFESRYDSPSLDGRDLRYLAALLLPLGLLPLAAPLALLPALPELGLNLLSSTITQTSVKTHYAATAIPALLAATVYGVARVGERAALRRRGGGALRRDRARAARPRRRRRGASRGSGPARARRRPRRCARQRDQRARRSSFRRAGGSSASPCSERPSGSSSTTRRLTFLDSLRPERARPALAALRRNPNWRLVFAEDGVLVFRRR